LKLNGICVLNLSKKGFTRLGCLSCHRIIYFDILRILATLGVMILHISAQNWDSISVTSFQWQTFNFFDSIVRWTVPIFVMISGAIFLDGDIIIKKIYKKNILKIITAFIFWSTLYGLLALNQGTSVKNVCVQVIRGHYHMWFLFMIVGLYLIVPLVKKIVESPVLTKYFLALALIFSFIIPQILTILTYVSKTFENAINTGIENINLQFTAGYIIYFVLGYYLSKTDISKQIRYIIYVLSILGFAITILGSSLISVRTNEPNSTLYGYFTLNVLMESLGLFVFFKYNVVSIKISGKMQIIITKLSNYSFGAYLVHAMVIEQLNNIFGLNTLSFNPILSVFAITFIVFVVSFLVSYICNHIVLLKKYIV